jgi:hypothetical protein
VAKGQASLVLQTTQRIFSSWNKSHSEQDSLEPELSTSVAVDRRDVSFLLKICSVLEQMQQSAPPSLTEGENGWETTPRDLFAATVSLPEALEALFVCPNCTVRSADECLVTRPSPSELSSFANSINEINFLMTQSSAEDILHRLFVIFVSRQKREDSTSLRDHPPLRHRRGRPPLLLAIDQCQCKGVRRRSSCGATLSSYSASPAR